MKEEYLTIAEFAKRAGVTRQTIYNRLDTDLASYTKLSGGKKMVNIKALKLFNVEPIDKNAGATFTDLAAYFEKEHALFSKLIDALELEGEARRKDVEILHKELEIKDKQIEALHTQIDQEQKLHAMTQQTSVSAHKLLSDSQRDPGPSPVDQDEIDAAYKRGRAEELKEIKRAFVELDKKYPEAARYFVAMLQSTSPRT